MSAPTEQEVSQALAQRTELLRALGESYQDQLEEQMGQLHNQFVAFIAAAKLPLPQVLLVLEILVAETIAQAKSKYLGGG
jgi:hypothetical protein